MNIATSLSFTGVMLAATAAPGPAMFYALDCGSRRGLRQAALAALGVSLMAACYASLALAGLATLLHRFGQCYLVLRCVGALYLLYCGWRALRAPVADAPATAPKRSGARLFLDAMLFGASNPKGILFFAALFPQFLPREVGASDSVLIVAIAFASSLGAMLLYAAGGAGCEQVLRRPAVRRAFARVSALLYAGFGLRLLIDKG